MAVNFGEIMQSISGANTLSEKELTTTFDEVRSEWLEAVELESEGVIALEVLMREVGKKFPLDDPRNPDSTVYQR